MSRNLKFWIGVILSILLILTIKWYRNTFFYENEIEILMQPDGEIEGVINLEKFKDLESKASEGKKYWVISATPERIVFHYNNDEKIQPIMGSMLFFGGVPIVLFFFLIPLRFR